MKRLGAARCAGVVCAEVLCERCGVHGAARCGDVDLRLPRAAAKGRARALALPTGAGERGFCGALLPELVGARSAAPAALLPIEENRKV